MKLFSNIKLPIFKGYVIAFFWISIILTLMAFVDKRQKNKVCQKVNIRIDNEYDNYFIENDDIQALMTKNQHENLINNIHEFINLKELEKRIKAYGFVEQAVVSKDLNGNIDVYVVQYQPLVRLGITGSEDKYISSTGKILPISDRFTSRSMVLTGAYTNLLAQRDWKNDNLRSKYFEFVKKIISDEYLTALIPQVEVNWMGEIIIYPQVGKQKIEFGKPVDIDVKFAKIVAFYKKIIPVKGWNAYEKVIVKYRNQIICEE